MIDKIRAWFRSQKIQQRDLELTPADVFKSFDIDFDGRVNAKDLKHALMAFVKVDARQITDLRLSRLIAVMSFHQKQWLDLSDFERILDRDWALKNMIKPGVSDDTLKNTSKCLGGGALATEPSNWKLQCIKAIGLYISRHYKSSQESFNEASQGSQKVNFGCFKAFVSRHNMLTNFSLTDILFQQLFAELDPHKKTFLTETDW